MIDAAYEFQRSKRLFAQSRQLIADAAAIHEQAQQGYSAFQRFRAERRATVNGRFLSESDCVFLERPPSLQLVLDPAIWF